MEKDVKSSNGFQCDNEGKTFNNFIHLQYSMNKKLSRHYLVRKYSKFETLNRYLKVFDL